MKYFKIILFNIIIIAFILVLTDYSIYKNACETYYKTFSPATTKALPPHRYRFFYKEDYIRTTLQYLKNNKKLDCFRPVVNDNLVEPIKRPILVFGCSFAYGGLLENDQTFSYKLQKYTNRKVYNYAVSAYGMQHMLYIVQNPRYLERVEGMPEYIIYVYISDHQRRLYSDPFPIETNGLYLRYRIKNNKIELDDEKMPSFLYRTFIVRRILEFFNKLHYKKMSQDELLNENFLLTNQIFLESKKILSERYPEIKFIILKYTHQQIVEEPLGIWDKLKEEGFIVVDSKDLIGRTFTVEDTTFDKFHPNEQAWDILVPKLVEKLKL